MPTKPQTRVEVVLKVTEVCNINCTYCYVFNKGDESYKTHDKRIKMETVTRLASVLRKGVEELSVDEVWIDFHGGEPLILKKVFFDEMCTVFEKEVGSISRLRLGLQTNATLVDEEWIRLFNKHNVSVGVSIDGPREVNDRYRLDHRGHSTYERTVSGLEKLREAYCLGVIPSFGALVVADPTTDAKAIVDHLIQDLKVGYFDILLPIDSHDSFKESPAAYGKYLTEAFNAWLAHGADVARIRLFDTAIRSLGYFDRSLQNQEKEEMSGSDAHFVLTISSVGQYGPDDSLRQVLPEAFSKHTIFETSLSDFLSSEIMNTLNAEEFRTPDECSSCAWQYVCRGGAANGRLINRYSEAAGFNNRSILCEGLREFYASIASYLLKAGLRYDALKQGISRSSSQFARYTRR